MGTASLYSIWFTAVADSEQLKPGHRINEEIEVLLSVGSAYLLIVLV